MGRGTLRGIKLFRAKREKKNEEASANGRSVLAWLLIAETLRNTARFRNGFLRNAPQNLENILKSLAFDLFRRPVGYMTRQLERNFRCFREKIWGTEEWYPHSSNQPRILYCVQLAKGESSSIQLVVLSYLLLFRFSTSTNSTEKYTDSNARDDVAWLIPTTTAAANISLRLMAADNPRRHFSPHQSNVHHGYVEFQHTWCIVCFAQLSAALL